MIGIAMDEARKGMSEKKNLTTEQIDQAMGLMQKFFIPFAIGGALFVYLLVGLISSLIGAAIAKKNPETTPFNQ